MRELDYQRPEMPLTQIDSNRPLQNRLDFRDLISEDRQKARSTYNDPMLTGIVQDVVNTEVYSMTTDITRETVDNAVRSSELNHSVMKFPSSVL